MLSLVDSRVEQLPHLRTLVLRVPRVVLVPERENPLLRTRLLLITSSATERNRESVFIQSLLQGCGFHNVGICGTMVERVDSLLNSLFIRVHDHLDTKFLRLSVAELYHFLKFPGRIDMHEWERRLLGVKAFRAKCSMTELSLPMEYNMTGFSHSAATSLIMYIASASS